MFQLRELHLWLPPGSSLTSMIRWTSGVGKGHAIPAAVSILSASKRDNRRQNVERNIE